MTSKVYTTIKFEWERTDIIDEEMTVSSRRKVNEERGSHGRGVKTWTDEEAAEKLASLRPKTKE